MARVTLLFNPAMARFVEGYLNPFKAAAASLGVVLWGRLVRCCTSKLAAPHWATLTSPGLTAFLGQLPRQRKARKKQESPDNLSGGLKTKEHPIGTIGVSMHASPRSSSPARSTRCRSRTPRLSAFQHGGAAVANYVSILERPR